MNEIQLKLCDIQGRLFELSVERKLGSAGFIKTFMNSETAKALDSTNACHDTYQRRPAGNRIPEYQCAYDFRDDCNKRNHGEHQPQIRGNL